MWNKIKSWVGLASDVTIMADTNIEFNKKKLEERADFNNMYNKELLEYTKNIRLESQDSKNWDHTRPLDAMEAMEQAEQSLAKDIDRYMQSDDKDQRAFGYKLKMDRFDDMLRAARTPEEKESVQKQIDLENKKIQKMENQREKQISKDDDDDDAQKIDELTRQIQMLEEQRKRILEKMQKH